VIDLVNEIAAETGANPAAVALAWVQAQPGITSTVIGARRRGFSKGRTSIDRSGRPAANKLNTGQYPWAEGRRRGGQSRTVGNSWNGRDREHVRD
jgi:hypothetical protein